MSTLVYLSPHLDDAALSCGGQIAQHARRGERVLVVTVFAGDVPAEAARTGFVQELHARWGAGQNPPAARRAEDVEACRILGAEAIHLGFPDCVYRLGRMGGPLYPTREAIFGEAAPVETPLVDEIASALGRLVAKVWPEVAGLARGVRCRGAMVYLPLTAGHHVDHQIVRAAGERWTESQVANGLRIAYYEDYPYAESPEEVGSALDGHPTLRYRADRAKGDESSTAAAKIGYTVNVVELGEDAIKAKLEAIACYRSQLSTFFEGDAEMEARVRAYARAMGGGRPAERVWKQEQRI